MKLIYGKAAGLLPKEADFDYLIGTYLACLLYTSKKNRMLKAALGLGAAMSLWMGLYAYGAQSSVIESVSVSFKTIYGEPEEIPEPEVTVSGKSCSLGDVQYRTDYDLSLIHI